MTRRLVTVCWVVLCLCVLPLKTFGAESLRAEVLLDYKHVWKTDVADADDRFTYRWTAVTENAPMPEGIATSYWDWHLQGNVEGVLSLIFVFDEPGDYQYRLEAYVPEKMEGYVYEPRTFLLDILVQNTADGGLEAAWYVLNELSQAKVDVIELDPSYTGGEAPITPTVAPTITPSVTITVTPTGAPTVPPTGTPTVPPTGAPTAPPTGAPTVPPTGAPTVPPTGAPTVPPTGAPTRVPTKAPTGIPTRIPTRVPTLTPTGGGRSGVVKTGDTSHVRSWATITLVSGVMCLFLLWQDYDRFKNNR